jgi:raffinose/stachyose/melibiose transport system permease protein
LPLFVLLRGVGLIGNPLGVALPQAAFGLPFTIIILRPFFRSIPNELEDAAKIDGCSTFGFFWRIVLPLSRPALATVSVLAIVGSWNAFFLPLLVFQGPEQWTLPLGVMNFTTEHTSDWARLLAFTSLSMAPAILFYAIAERHIVSGLTAGSLEGQ